MRWLSSGVRVCVRGNGCGSARECSSCLHMTRVDGRHRSSKAGDSLLHTASPSSLSSLITPKASSRTPGATGVDDSSQAGAQAASNVDAQGVGGMAAAALMVHAPPLVDKVLRLLVTWDSNNSSYFECALV
jgi:hypothetical protein